MNMKIRESNLELGESLHAYWTPNYLGKKVIANIVQLQHCETSPHDEVD